MFNLQQFNEKQEKELGEELNYCDTTPSEDKRLKSFLKSSNTELLKSFLEGEVERLEEEKYDDPVSQGEYSGHAEGHNFILDKIITHYKTLINTLK